MREVYHRDRMKSLIIDSSVEVYSGFAEEILKLTEWDVYGKREREKDRSDYQTITECNLPRSELVSFQ